MTNQEAFEKSVRHVMSQTRQCGDSNTCFYSRGQEACAIGILLPPDVRASMPSNAGVDSPSVKGVVKQHLAGVDGSLLQALQDTHDQVDNRELEDRRELFDRFQVIADDFDLRMPADVVRT